MYQTTLLCSSHSGSITSTTPTSSLLPRPSDSPAPSLTPPLNGPDGLPLKRDARDLPPGAGKRCGTVSRERYRQQNVSGAFAELRKLLPTHPLDKKLSKSEILKLSIKYIRLLQGVLKWQEEQERATAVLTAKNAIKGMMRKPRNEQ